MKKTVLIAVLLYIAVGEYIMINGCSNSVPWQVFKPVFKLVDLGPVYWKGFRIR